MKAFEKKLVEKFNNRDSFTRNELYEFFKEYEPDLKQGTFGWRIYVLRHKGIIKPVCRGIYTLLYKQVYEPAITPDIEHINRKLADHYDKVKYCVWSTAWLNPFSQHQTLKTMLLIDIEKEFVESAFYYLKDNLKYEIFLNPDTSAVNYYIAESHYPVIIKGLISRSPIKEITVSKRKVPVPVLEKILVDIFVDSKLFYYYHGSELRYIFRNAVEQYAINYTTLYSYAKRRGKGKEIESFVMNIIDVSVKDISND